MWRAAWTEDGLELEADDGHVFCVPRADLADVMRDLLQACSCVRDPTPRDLIEPYRVTEDETGRAGAAAQQEFEADRYDAWRDAA